MPSKKRKSTGARKKKVPVKKSCETEKAEQQPDQEEKYIQKDEKVHEGQSEGMTLRSGSATKQEQKPFQIPLPLTRHLQLALPAPKEKTNESKKLFYLNQF